MTKEENLLKIAEEEFIQNGYRSTSMVTVAKRAGLTHAMVNYYYRSKEQLFQKILDAHVTRFISRMKMVMNSDDAFVQIIVNTSCALYDALNEDRSFPFLIQDVIRTCPELLDIHREKIEENIRLTFNSHSRLLAEEIAKGMIKESNMTEIVETVFSLVVSPFLLIPALENLCGYDEDRIEDYLSRRKRETAEIITARYSISDSNIRINA